MAHLSKGMCNRFIIKLRSLKQNQAWLAEQTGLSEMKISDMLNGIIRRGDEKNIQKIETVLFPEPDQV